MSRVTKITIKILAGLFICYLIIGIAFAFPTFDGGMYILDDNHLMFGWPDSLITQRNINTGKPKLISFESDIEKFSVTDNYILLKAGDEWYAINRQDYVISQFENLDDLKDRLKIQGKIHFTTSRPWLRLRFFWPAALVSITLGICTFILLFFKEIKSLIVSREERNGVRYFSD